MNIKVAYTREQNPDKAAAELKTALSAIEARTVLYFASSALLPDALAKAMQDAFSGAQTFGCTTAGEICSGFMADNSIVAMALNEKIVEEIKIEILPDLSRDVKGAVNIAAAALEKHFGTSLADMDFQKYVGVILIDGLSATEERLMDSLGNLTNISIVGGSAGDDLKFKQTHVFADGRAYTNAAVLALIKAGGSFSVLKTQSFRILDKILTATKVNEERREVMEFNGKSAVAAYAEAVGTTVEKAADHFMRYPVGLVVDGEPYVRSPQRIEGDSIFFYCNILEGMDLSLLESTDIVADTGKAVEKIEDEKGPIEGIVNFHCILRTLELKSKNQTEDYAAIFKDIPTIGFSTYGEELIGHINQTSTMLIFS